MGASPLGLLVCYKCEVNYSIIRATCLTIDLESLLLYWQGLPDMSAALAFRKQGYLESAQTELQNLLQDLTVGFHEDKPDEPDPKKQDGDARTG